MNIFSVLIFLGGIFFSASEHVLLVALFEDDMENELKLPKSSLRRCNLIQLVYGKSTSTSETSSKEVQDSIEGEESDEDEFFKPKVEGNKVFLDIICMVISLIIFFLI